MNNASEQNRQPPKSIAIQLKNETDTQALANKLAQLELIGSVWLVGDLGAGKTTLSRYWLKALGHTGSVKSPTYTLVEPYQIKLANGTTKPVYHADLYRLQDPEELEFIGFDEYLQEENSLVIIEWASRAENYLPEPIFTISIAETSISETSNEERANNLRQVNIQLTDTGVQQGIDLSLVELV